MTDEQKLTLPASVKIGYMTYQILPWETGHSRGSGYLGECDHFQGIIKVDTSTKKEESLNTLIHEMLHAIWHFMGLNKEQEETIVNCLSNGLTGVLLANPEIVQFVASFLPKEAAQAATDTGPLSQPVPGGEEV